MKFIFGFLLALYISITAVAENERPQNAALGTVDAEKEVRNELKKKGWPEGFDKAHCRIVIVGSCQREINDLKAPDFFKTRSSMIRLAVFSAKREIVQTICLTVFAADSVDVVARGENVEQITTSVFEAFSKRPVFGCNVVSFAESYSDGIYEVAVAVEWSEELEKKAKSCLENHVAVPPAAENDKVWNDWAGKADFSKMADCVSFVDDKGVVRFAGLGFAVLEGKKGKEVAQLKKNAKLEAQQNLAYALYSDLETYDKAKTILSEKIADGKELSEATEDFLFRVTTSCNKFFTHRSVYSGKIRHVVSGGEVYVYVAGADPEIIRNIKELNEK